MAREFDGSVDGLQQDSTEVTGYPYSVSAWFYADNATHRGTVICLDRGTDLGGVVLIQVRGDSTGDPVEVLVGTAESNAIATSSTGFTANTWHHVAITVTSSLASVYLDGEGLGTDSHSVGDVSYSRQFLGYRSKGPTHRLDGRVESVTIWDGLALSQSQARQLAAGAPPLSVQNLSISAHWPLVRDLLQRFNSTGTFAELSGSSTTYAPGPIALHRDTGAIHTPPRQHVIGTGAGSTASVTGVGDASNGFDPGRLGDLDLWLSSLEGTFDASEGSNTWVDGSGNGNNFGQSDSAKRPSEVTVRGLPMVSFDGSNDTLTRPDDDTFDYSGDFSLFVVFRTADVNRGAFWGKWTSSFGTSLRVNNADTNNGDLYSIVRDSSMNSVSAIDTASDYNTDEIFCVALIRDGDDLDIYVDGTLVTTGSGAGVGDPSNAAQPYVGSLDGVSHHYDGELGEVLMFAKALAGADQDYIWDNLAERWKYSGFGDTGTTASVVGSGSGTVTDTVTGTGAGTAPSVVGAGSGEVEFEASGAGTAPSATGTGSATVQDQNIASGSGIAPSVTGTGTAEVSFDASGAGETASPTGAGQAELAFDGAAITTTPAVAGTGSGVVVSFVATGAGTTAPPSATGSALLRFDATGAGSTPSVSGTGTAAEQFEATGEGVAPAVAGTGTATAGDVVTGTGAGSTTAPSSTGSAELEFEATGAGSSAPATGTGVGESRYTGTGAGTTPAPSSTGSAELTFEATGAGSTSAPQSTGSGQVVGAQGTGAGTTAPPTGTGVGLQTFAATGAGTAPAALGAGSGTVTDSFIATGAGSTAPPQAAGAALLAFEASGSPLTPSATGTGTGSALDDLTGSGAGSAPSVTGQGAAELVFVGSGAGSTAPATGTGASALVASGAGSGTVAPPSAAGAGLETFEATGAGSATAPTGFGSAELVHVGIGAVTAPAVTGAGSAELILFGQPVFDVSVCRPAIEVSACRPSSGASVCRASSSVSVCRATTSADACRVTAEAVVTLPTRDVSICKP